MGAPKLAEQNFIPRHPQWGLLTNGFLPEDDGPEHEADHSPPSTASFQGTWLKNRGNLAFTFHLMQGTELQLVVLTSVDAAVRWGGATSRKGCGTLSSPPLAALSS
jgi:hypothetical protein